MRKSKCKINKARLTLIIIVFIIFLFFSILIAIEKSIQPKIVNICNYYCKAQLSKIINNSVSEVITEKNIKYTDIAVKLMNGNEISAVDIRTENVNKIRAAISERITKKIEYESNNEISIPLGNISDLFFLSGRGPEISVIFLPEAAVTTKINSKLSSAGINQTGHTVGINITVDAIIILPSENIEINVSSDCILAESILIGDVPEGIIGNYAEK